MASWTEETVQLIDVWGKENIQERCPKNRRIYERIATDMQKAGYNRTAIQCQDQEAES